MLMTHISSPAFDHMDFIPKKYTCDGVGISPPLRFDNVPDTAVSLVLIMEDPDVPRNLRVDGMWDHWMVWNISPHVHEISEGETIEGIYGTTTSGTCAYVPPCPPDAEHRYFFTLYALDALLSLEEGATKDELCRVMNEHVIEQSTLIGVYCKKTNQI